MILVLYKYDTPYPAMGALTSGTVVSVVSSVADPYPGFSGVVDPNAAGAIGSHTCEAASRLGIEVRIPVEWYGSTGEGAVKADGTGTNIVQSAVFTGTGSLSAVGTVEDTLNDAAGSLVVLTIDLTNGTSSSTTSTTTSTS